jgi:serine/threonine protein kinase
MSWSSNLGPFVLEYPIGRGGMGEVWLAHHRVDGVPVAIKVLTHGGAGDDRFIAAFRDEVRAVAALDHPSFQTLRPEIPRATIFPPTVLTSPWS